LIPVATDPTSPVLPGLSDRTGALIPAPRSSGGSDVLDRQRRRESNARTYARNFPIVPVRADGMQVQDAEGKTYLDCLSGAGTLALGHNHPVVLEALRRVIDSGAPLHMLDFATPEKDAFTTELLSRLPASFADRARLHFCGPAGTDAVEAALKLTTTATGRSSVLAFTGAYHGMTAGALAVTGNVDVRARLGSTSAATTRLPYPYPYRCPFGVGGDASARISANYVERLLDDPSGGVLPPAAMILEPVQGEGGAVPAPDGWLREMRRITAERGIPLVLDEVQTGVGRTGTFWGFEHSGVQPDVVVMSKAVGGSLPLAVIAYDQDLDVWSPGAHTGTFRGNTLAMAAGTATLRFVAEQQLPDRAAQLGARMIGALEQLATRHRSIGDVRGRGLMIGIELVDPDAEPDACGARPPASELAAQVRRECLERGLIVELGGRHDAVVRLLPPLIITDEQADSVLERLADSLDAAERAAQAKQA
jgi:diaminobutyrate-2-oxoglutarate transaminase